MTSIAQAYVEILPSARGMGNALRGELGGMESTLGASSRRGFLGGFAGIAAPLAAVIGGIGIGSMISDSITAASDLAETASAVEVVFGDANRQVADFADGAARSLGMTQQQALEGARTFGIFGQAAGLQGSDLANFSTDLVGLATDFASFNNVDPAQAIDAIGAGLRGESEPLRQFGILLDDAALRAQALEMGIYDGNGALSQQQRVMAAQAEIFDQAGSQAGDFERTSDGLANQQRILQAQWEDFTAEVGTAFLPIMTDLVTMLNDDFMPVMEDVIDVFQSEEFRSEMQEALEELAPLIPDIADAFVDLVRESVPMIPTMVDLAAALLPLLPPLTDMAMDVIPLLAEALEWAMPGLQWMTDLLSTSMDFSMLSVIPMLFDGLDKAEIDGLRDSIYQFFNLFGIDLEEMINRVTPMLVGLMDDTLVIFGGIGDGMRAIAEGDFGAIPGIIAATLDEVENNTRVGVDDVGKELGGLSAAAKQAGLDASRSAKQAGRSISSGLAAGIRENKSAATSAISEVMAGVKAYMPQSPADRGPFSGSGWAAVAGSGEAIVEQFRSGLSGMDDVITSSVPVPRVPVSAEVAGYAASVGGAPFSVTVNTEAHLDEYLVGQVTGNAVSRALGGK